MVIKENATRRKAEAALKEVKKAEKHALIGLLESIATDLSLVENIAELGAMVESTVERVLDVSFTGIYLFDTQSGRLRLLFARGFTEEERAEAERTAMDRHPGEVFRTGKMLHVPDTDKEPDKSTTSDRSFVVRSRLYLPVLSRETCVGCFGLASSVPHAFSDEHIQLLRFVGNMATVVYQNFQAKERAAHLNRVLAAIRDINQLIVRETDRESLLAGACRLLVEVRGFESALIVPAANGVPDAPAFQTRRVEGGKIEEGPYAPLSARLDTGFVPLCGRMCLEAEGVHAVTDRTARCGECPLVKLYPINTAALSTRITHEGRVFGWLTVATPLAWADNPEEYGLLGEVAGDLAYALHNLEAAARERAAHEALAESERRLSVLFEHTPSISVQGYNSRREVIFWNRASEEFYGYTAQEALGRQLEDLIIPDAMREGVIAAVAAWVAGGPAFPAGPLVLKRADGSDIPVFSSHMMTRNARGEAEMYCIDISLEEQRRLEAELAVARQAEEENRFARLFHDNPTPMAVTGWPDRRFLEVNAAFLAGCGYAREEVVGANSMELNAFVDPAALAALGARLEARQSIRNFEARLRRKNGGELTALISCDRFPYAGRECLLWALTDISEQKRAEAAAQEARAQAEGANRAKSEFLANMSHELRTPLSAILGLSEGLLEQTRGPLNERQQASLRTVQASGRHLLGLLNEILDLARIEAGRLEVVREWSPAREACEAALALVREQAAAKGIALELRLGDPEAHLEADPRRLKQILVNLLANAVKFTPEGGRVELATAAAGNEALAFTVTDTGIGIAPEDQARLFQPFVQIDAGLARRHEGTGLGMSLVRRLADLHGGGVTLESEPGKGSRFTVTLPVGTRPAKSAAENGTALIRPPRPTALVVEDSPEAYAQLAGYLTELGYAVSGHDRGAGAVEAAREQQPGLVVLDLLLPDLSGWEVLSGLKAEAATREIPVLVVSVVDAPGRAQAAGAAGHLLKPVSRAALAGALAAVERGPAPGSRGLILLAEDNEWNIQTVAGYLEDRGFEVEVARDGVEALEMAKARPPDLVLMDIQMPRLDGIEATKRLRAELAFAQMPIVALTALAMPGDEERCRAAGTNAYLTKPVGMKELIETIETLLAGAEGKEERTS